MVVQSKLRLALGSVKDHASIGKAMIYSRDHGLSSIDIAVLRATGHDNTPIDDKHMHEILFLVSNSPASVPYLAERISHRLDKTRDPIVALKTHVLVHRLLRGGNRKFEQDLRNAHLSGHLQLSTRWFPTNSDLYPISFLHSYAAFLEERLGWVINQAGKLEPIMFQGLEFQFHEERSIEMVFHRLPRCQVFLDKVLRCSPLEILPDHNCLSWVAMRNILRESFQVYATFSEGVATLADSFFNFNNPARVLALEVLRKASSQSYELCNFFENCKTIIGTKNLDYPSVEIITKDHVSSMEQFLKSSSSSETYRKNNSLYTRSTGSTLSPIHNHITKPIACKSSQAYQNTDDDEEEAKVMKTKTSTCSFPHRLETKISTVWVLFDEEDQTQSSNMISLAAACYKPASEDDHKGRMREHVDDRYYCC